MIRERLFERKGMKLPFIKFPLNQAGEELRLRLEDEIFGFSLGFGFVLSLILFILFRTFSCESMTPLTSFAVHLVITIPFFFMTYVYSKIKLNNIINCRLGYLGEKMVGQELERSRTLGYAVFHDLHHPEKKFNVDHIAIGKAGIIVIETKAKSKPQKGSPEIKYDGQKISFPDGSYTADPLAQVEANSRWIQEMAHKLIGAERKSACPFNMQNPVPVLRIVVYPGWFVDYSEAQRKKAQTLVTNDELLVDSVIKSFKQPSNLSDEMILELQEIFERHLRSENKITT